MSPVERVDSWRVGSSSSVNSGVGRKRKAPMTPSTSSGGRRKAPRLQEEYSDDVSDVEEHDVEEDEEGSEVEEDEVELEAMHDEGEEGASDEEMAEDGYDGADEIDLARSSTPADHESFYDEYAEGDTSLLVSEQDYASPRRKKIISPTQEAFDRGITDAELREQGWDDDHIVLVQKIAMRGYEPLLPHHYKFEWPFYPDALFADDDNAFLTTLSGRFFRGSKALGRLFELGGRVRDCVLLNGRTTPEQQTKKMVKEYIKWADADANLDTTSAIPMLAIECQPSSIPAARLQEKARAKLDKLAARYRTAFRVNQSIERSPTSRASTVLAHPIPTLYAIVASGTLVALVAYNPADENPDVKPIAFFQMNDTAYDVWNALALAIIICHVRNIQIRIAEETGLGVKGPEVKVEVDDPDL